MDYCKKVPVDKYLNHKEEFDVLSEFIDVKPVDIYGNIAPLGNSAADRSRNLKDVAQNIQDRVGC